ncbi:MAG: hypothetical protein ACYS76_13390 [Planctomycetota bacterium]|jgi:hypothetical protein
MILAIEKATGSVWTAVSDEGSYEEFLAGFIADPSSGIDSPDDMEPLWVPGDTLADPRPTMTQAELVALVKTTVVRMCDQTAARLQAGFPHEEPQAGSQWSQWWTDLTQLKNAYDGTGDWPTFPLAPDGEYHW